MNYFQLFLCNLLIMRWLSATKFLGHQFDRLTKTHFSESLTAKKRNHQSSDGHTSQLRTNRTKFPKLRFAQRQILFVIFEMQFNFPTPFIAFVNSHTIVKGLIAEQNIIDNFSFSTDGCGPPTLHLHKHDVWQTLADTMYLLQDISIAVF